jgi:hypothetical protein
MRTPFLRACSHLLLIDFSIFLRAEISCGPRFPAGAEISCGAEIFLWRRNQQLSTATLDPAEQGQPPLQEGI